MIKFNQPLSALKPWVDTLPQGLFDLAIHNICFDSREVSQGDAFFVLPSVAANESIYIEQAINNGAAIIVVSEAARKHLEDQLIPYLLVADIVTVAGNVLSHVLNQGRKTLQVVGITGTNGK